MTLTPRFAFRPRVAIAAAFTLLLPLAAAAATASVLRHPVGWARVPHPALARPTVGTAGAVYVPQSLKIIPTGPDADPVADEPGAPIDAPVRVPQQFRSASPSGVAAVGANVRLNDTSGDPFGSTQSETYLAANGLNLVAGWNDGTNFGISPGASGYSYSSDGGLTWTDGGVPPAPATARYEGDPCLTVDNAGNFYYSNLYTPDGSTSAVSVNRGTFTGALFTWNPPVMVASTLTDFLDKEWIAVDRVSGIVYVSFTHFLAAGGDEIDFSRSTDNGATWSVPMALTNPANEGVQGSRIAVGPSGEVQVIYFVYDNASANNYMRTRRSTTAGTSFGPEVTLPTGPSGIISNYGSGPAGFNRPRGIGFPSLAIDRTGGANSGRVYATWEETFNFYYDPLGTLGPVAETEANNTVGTANPIAIGQTVTGTLSSTTDQDWFSFSGVAGQKVILYLVPGSPAADGFIRLFCGGGAASNRAMLSYIGFGTGLVVYSLPSTGTYYFRILANSSSLGNYVVYTGFDGPDPGDEVANDTRDAVIQSSPDGVAWDWRRVVNDDPPRFDNAFPEVAVDGVGQVFVDWYDHRADPCGIGTDIYYSRSGDGGVTFLPSIKVNDGPPINWSLVSSNLAPNMGDYSALVADGCAVYANFADGRQGSPDSWMAPISDCPTPTQIALVSADARPGRVGLSWYVADRSDLVATVYRKNEGGDWNALETIQPDGTGALAYQDLSVAAGGRYGYRLGIADRAGERFYGEVWVDVPSGLTLSLGGARPNPVTSELDVSFTLPSAAPATLELLDIAGRSIVKRDVAGQGIGNHVVRLGDLTSLRAGLYVVRLTQGSRTLSTKAMVVR